MARQLLAKLRSFVALMTIGGTTLFLWFPIDCDPNDQSGDSEAGSRWPPFYVQEKAEMAFDPNDIPPYFVIDTGINWGGLLF
jgi:hypothetical protein